MSAKPTYEELEQKVKELEKETFERKREEETLRKTEERFRSIYEESLVGIEIYDSKGQLLHANKACLDIFGIVNERQIQGFRLFDDPNLPDKEKSKLRKGQMVRYEATFDFDLVKKNGLYDTTKSGIAYLDVVITPFASKGNDGSGEYLVQVQDNTERKQAEEARQTEIDKLETITQNIGAGLCIISKDYRTLWANQVLKQIFGEVEGKVCYETYNQQTDICPNCGVREIFETGKDEVTHEEVGKDADGQTIWSEIIATPIRDKEGNIISALELVVPITERKKAEEGLQRERDFISAVLSTAGALVIVLDRQGRIVRFNKACKQLTSYSFEEVQGKHFWDLFLIPEEVEPVKAVFAELKAGHFPNEYENFWVTKDGSRHLIMWSNTTLFDYEGSVEYVIGTGIDITERKQAEEALQKAHDKLEIIVQERTAELLKANEQLAQKIDEHKQAEVALRESEERFRNVYETAPLAFVVWDKNIRVTDWNKKAEETFGWSKEEVVDHNFFDFLIPEKDRPHVEDVVDGLRKGDLLSHSINKNLTKEGKLITCESVMSG